jgi:hypothetical protein
MKPNLAMPKLGGMKLGGILGKDGVSLVTKNLKGELPSPNEDGMFEEAAKEEVGDTLKRMKALSVAATARFEANTDVGYFLCVCFMDHHQVQAFLDATGWDKFNGGEGRYVNGVDLARSMGVELPPSAFKPFEPKVEKL